MRALVLCVAIAALPLSAGFCRRLSSTHSNDRVEAHEASPVASDALKTPSQPPCLGTGMPNNSQAIEALSQMPRMFLENLEPGRQGVRFVTRGAGLTTYLLDGAFVVQQLGYERSSQSAMKHARPDVMANVFVTFEGASRDARVEGKSQTGSQVTLLKGGAPSLWRPEIPNFKEVVCHDIYRGIDLRFHDQNHILEYDLVLHPGARLVDVALRYDGIEGLDIDEDGSLVTYTKLGTLRQSPPVTYEIAPNGSRREVECRYRLFGMNRFGFVVTTESQDSTLVIDPGIMLIGTYVGGVWTDHCYGLAVDAVNGYSFLTGETDSSNSFLINGATVGAWDVQWNDGVSQAKDAFVAKIGPLGRSVIYMTFLGGDQGDIGNGIVINSAGEAYVAGSTNSALGTTPSSTSQTFYTSQTFPGGTTGGVPPEAFVFKLNSSGSSAVFSAAIRGGILPGNGSDEALAIALYFNNNIQYVYICGRTFSSNLPVVNAFQPTLQGPCDAFVAKFMETPSGSALSQVYLTYLGTPVTLTTDERANGIAVDSLGQAWVVGKTGGPGFPVTGNAFQNQAQGQDDAFITAIPVNGNPPGTPSLAYSTYFGGIHNDVANGVCFDPNGLLWLVGETDSSVAAGFPISGGAHSSTLNPPPPVGTPVVTPGWTPSDAFVASFQTGFLITMNTSTFYGGYLDDAGIAIAANSQYVYITGCTQSPNGIAYQVGTNPPFSSSCSGIQDAFVARFTTNTGAMAGASYFGGSATGTLAHQMYNEVGRAVALDGTGSSYVAGSCGTGSPATVPLQTYDFPKSPLCYQPLYGGKDFDGFLVKFAP